MRRYFPPAVTRRLEALALRLYRKGIVRWNGLSLPASWFQHRDNNSLPTEQKLDVYWTASMAAELEEWGEGTSWREIMFLLSVVKGRILDIACGTGKVMQLASIFSEAEIYGCDVSDLLIAKAVERGLSKERLKVCDFTKSGYPDAYFDHSYSLGSLEHFTDEGIDEFLSECRRITRGRTFHMIPVSRSGEDDGWITTTQSYFNNSSAWWKARFETHFEQVYVLDSAWGSILSRGQWFVCSRA